VAGQLFLQWFFHAWIMSRMIEHDAQSQQRRSAKIVGFLLLGLAFSMLIAALTAPLPLVPHRVLLGLFAVFGIFWAYRFMRIGRGGD
jgi:uncharacterized membrane protein